LAGDTWRYSRGLSLFLRGLREDFHNTMSWKNPKHSKMGTVSANAGETNRAKTAAPSSDEAIVPVPAAEESTLETHGPSTPVGAAPSVPPDSLERFKQLEEENAQLVDQLLRKQAEFENFRKRMEREKSEFLRFANLEIVRELLPVLDGFERALKVETAGEMESFRKGMELVYKQLMDGLQRTGLSPIDSVGRPFDPNFHQAVVHEERDDVFENLVIEEYQRGYLFQGRLLRPAMVKVASGKKHTSDRVEKENESTIH